jgi:hypothetical protein
MGDPGTGQGPEDSVFNVDRVSVLENENVLGVDGGEGCTALRMCPCS